MKIYPHYFAIALGIIIFVTQIYFYLIEFIKNRRYKKNVYSRTRTSSRLGKKER